MVCAARVQNRQRIRADIIKRCEPRLENRRDRAVALHVNAADFARSVVEIVISVEFIVICAFRDFKRLRLSAAELVAAGRFAEMLFDVFARTV